MPRVSIPFITWNHEKYIGQAIESLAKQSFRDFEILFLDNCSTDNTHAVAIETFKTYGLQIRDCSPNAPQGVSTNLNCMIELAEGELIAPISGDDWWHQENLIKKVAFFDQNPETGLLYSGGYTYYDHEDRLELMDTRNAHSGQVFDKLLQGNFVVGIGNVVPKKVYKELGLYNTNLKIEDWDMWLRIAQHYKVGYIPEPLIYYRRHSNSYSHYSESYLEEQKKVIEPYASYKSYKKGLKTIERFRISNEPASVGNILRALKQVEPNIYSIKILLASIKRLLLDR